MLKSKNLFKLVSRWSKSSSNCSLVNINLLKILRKLILNCKLSSVNQVKQKRILNLNRQRNLKLNLRPAESTEDEEPQLTQEDVDFLQDMAGGKDGYESMLKWAANTLQQKEIDMYDLVMEQGNPNSVYFAVSWY